MVKKRPPPNVGAAIANELMDTTVWKGRCAAKCLVEVVPKSVQILTSYSVIQMCILNHLHDQNYLDNPLDQPLSGHMIALKMLLAVNIITKSCPWHRGQTHFISLEPQHVLHTQQRRMYILHQFNQSVKHKYQCNAMHDKFNFFLSWIIKNSIHSNSKPLE